MLKIDVDNKKFKKWMGDFEWTYRQISNRIRIREGAVYRTRHGFHVYIEFNGQTNISMDRVLLIESLLGSDRKKQVYAFKEGNDILFTMKNGYSEKFEDKKTRILQSIITKIDQEKSFLKMVEIKTKRKTF